jgi:uncharacterized repeat protein (TIGR01451 family)
MLEFKSPFTLKASNIKSASLSARLRMYDETPSYYNLTVTNGSGDALGTVTLTYSGAIAGGVYRLQLRDTSNCCCFSGLVYTPGCPPVSTPSTYTGDGGVIEPQPSGCEVDPPTPVTLTVDAAHSFFVISPSMPKIGDTGTVRVTVTNTGTTAYTGNVVINNPAGLTLTGPTITGSLDAGQTKEWLWQATINAAGTHTTTATANGVSDSYSTVATA